MRPLPSIALGVALILLPAVLPAPMTTGLGIGGSVRAQTDLASAKAQGLVGERPDGLVGVVPESVPPEIVQLVERTNAERTARYAEVARATGQALAEVQAVAGDRLLAATPPGQFIMNAAGRWVRR